jgi:hypothetical protein
MAEVIERKENFSRAVSIDLAAKIDSGWPKPKKRRKM